jgi:transcription elongation factor Elf1
MSDTADYGGKPRQRVAESDPCPRCGTELSKDDLQGVVGKGGVSAIARCGSCHLLWSPSMGWYGDEDDDR